MTDYKVLKIELRAQRRAKESQLPKLASRPPQDPTNVARLSAWRTKRMLNKEANRNG